MTSSSRIFLAVSWVFLAASAAAQTANAPRSLEPGETELRALVSVHAVPTLLYRGSPFVLTLYVAHAGYDKGTSLRISPEPLVIDTQGGSWNRLLQVEMSWYDKQRKRRMKGSWPLKPVGDWPSRVVLTPTDAPVAIARYVLSAEQTSELLPTNYLISAWLNTRVGTSQDSWKGSRLGGAEVSVVDVPAQLTATEECRKVLGLQEYLLVTGDEKQALAVLDGFLARASLFAGAECWAARARLHEGAGNLPAARDAYCTATTARAEDEAAADREPRYSASKPTISPSPYSARCQELTQRLAAGDAGALKP